METTVTTNRIKTVKKETFNIKAYNEKPNKDGLYLCLTKGIIDKKEHVHLEVMMRSGNAWQEYQSGYYFEDNFGVDLFWLDAEIDWDYGFITNEIDQSGNKEVLNFNHTCIGINKNKPFSVETFIDLLR